MADQNTRYIYYIVSISQSMLELEFDSIEMVDIQGGPKSDTPLVFEFPHILGASDLQLLFNHVGLSFALNDVIIR